MRGSSALYYCYRRPGLRRGDKWRILLLTLRSRVGAGRTVSGIGGSGRDVTAYY